MNLSDQAKNVARAGRYGDTTLLHLHPDELKGIASVVPLTINPDTGYAEAFVPLIAAALAAQAAAAGTTAMATGLTLGAGAAGAAGGLGAAGAAGAGLGGIGAGATGAGLEATLGATGGVPGLMAGTTMGGAMTAPWAASVTAPLGAAQGIQGLGAVPGGMSGASGPGGMVGGGVPGGGGPPGLGGANPSMVAGRGPLMSPQAVPRPVPGGAQPMFRGMPNGMPGQIPQGVTPRPVPGGAQPLPHPGQAPYARPAPQPSMMDNVGSFMKDYGKPIATLGPMAMSAMPQGGGGPRKKKKGEPHERERSVRDYTNSDPDPMGRENDYFSRRRTVPYNQGGMVGYAHGGMPTNPFPMQPQGIPSRNWGTPIPQRTRAPMQYFDRPPQSFGVEQMNDVLTPSPTPTPAPAPVGGGGIGGFFETPRKGLIHSSEKAQGGLVGYAEGGITSMMGAPSTGGEDEVVVKAVMAIRDPNQTPQARQAAIKAFIEKYGARAFEALMQREMAGGAQPPGDGLSDSIPATNPDGAPAALSAGEYVVPADAVSHLGNGDTQAGGEVLGGMIERVRGSRTGSPNSPDQIDPRQMLPG